MSSVYDIGIYSLFAYSHFAYFSPKSGVLPTHKNKPTSGCHFDIVLMRKYHFVKSRRNATFWAFMVTCLFPANRLYCTCLFVVGGVVASITIVICLP